MASCHFSVLTTHKVRELKFSLQAFEICWNMTALRAHAIFDAHQTLQSNEEIKMNLNMKNRQLLKLQMELRQYRVLNVILKSFKIRLIYKF